MPVKLTNQNMLAARSVGLDCGPMGGFNAETLDQEFFPDGKTKSFEKMEFDY
jgi:nitroreductase